MKVRLLVLLGIGFLTIASGVPAAAGDCRDALISDPPKRYLCTSAYAYTEAGPPYLQGTSSFEAEFVEASPRDPAVFVMRAANGNEIYCACNSRGSAARPSFLSSMSFTCQGESVMRGTVTGRNGDRIRDFAVDEIKPQIDGGSELNIGGCVRIR